MPLYTWAIECKAGGGGGQCTIVLLLKRLNVVTRARFRYLPISERTRFLSLYRVRFTLCNTCTSICNFSYFPYEPRREINRFFAYAKTNTQISFAVTAKLISAFVIATLIVQPLYFLNPKFQASSHLLWLHSLVCVGPGRKPRRPVFS